MTEGFIAAIGAVWLGFSGYRSWAGFSSIRWAKSEAAIEDARVEFVNTGLISARWQVLVAYSYCVGGQRFTNTVVRFDDGYYFGLERDARDVVARSLMPGQQVDVWYDPEDPARSVLHPGPQLRTVAQLLVALILLVGGVVGLVMR